MCYIYIYDYVHLIFYKVRVVVLTKSIKYFTIPLMIMSKMNVSVTIDIDLHERAKSKGCPFSHVFNAAIKSWLATNQTIIELEMAKVQAEAYAKDAKVNHEAEIMQLSTLQSSYFTKMAKETFTACGFTDEEIERIFIRARELHKLGKPPSSIDDTEISKD